MARSKIRYRDGTRSSIGDEHVSRACTKIDTAMLKEIAANTPQHSLEYLTRMMFDDNIIALLKEANRFINSASNHSSYRVVDVNLTFTFKDHPAPSSGCVVIQHDRGEEFFRTLAFINECRKKWGLVKYVLRYLNNNATPGAIRALWPSALHLCNTSPAFHDLKHAPVRYSAPDNLGPLLPLLRETATTVALMGMMPESMETRQRREAYMTLSPGSFTHENTGLTIPLDYVTVGL